MSGLPSEWLSPKFIFYFRWVAYEVTVSFYVFLLGTVHFSPFNLNLPQLEVSIFLKIFKKTVLRERHWGFVKAVFSAWKLLPILNFLSCLENLSMCFPGVRFSLLYRVVYFCSIAQSCLSDCNPMDCSTPGFPVYHRLLEHAQTHIHWISDAIQPSHPLSSPSPPASVFSSIRIFSNESVLCIRWPKHWNFSFSISPSKAYSGLISFRTDKLDSLAH